MHRRCSRWPPSGGLRGRVSGGYLELRRCLVDHSSRRWPPAPGRVDQAVELTLPDSPARRRLFELYCGGLDVDASRLGDVINQTDGVTASFLKELLRWAALLAAGRLPDEDAEAVGCEPLAVSADDLASALAELLDTRNAMTRVLLGGRSHAEDERE